MIDLAVGLAAAVASGLASLRWLRVAQREHYIAGSCTRFAARWWFSSLPNVALVVVATAGAVGSFVLAAIGLAAVVVEAVGPLGLSLRGRTSPLRWTARLRRLAATAAVVYLAVGLPLALALGTVGPVVVATTLVPVVVDAALALTGPIERRLSERFVAAARRRLEEVRPRVVALTGSYGKTTTKAYIAHLVAGRFTVLASPASFNNRLGLARAVNDHLSPGTEVFVAEMGTYGRGEIAELVTWIRPEVSVLTAVGPVHLERFHTLDAIAEAKAEIVDGASTVVLNADDERIAGAVERAGTEARIVRCSTADPAADVHVADGRVLAGGAFVGEVDRDRFGINVACAVGVALALEVPTEAVAERLATLPDPEHRRQVATSARGVAVVDDTFNSNPPGARAALRALAAAAPDGARRVVVTPGMVELGPLQRKENEAFAAEAAALATDLLVVGRTNRQALLAGARTGGARVHEVRTREEAVQWVRANLSEGDAVLYENDLPDHYP